MTGHVEGLFIPLITGQPFHAKIAVQIHHQLPDGTIVDQKYYTLVARDSNGREYREARNRFPPTPTSIRPSSTASSTIPKPR